MTTKLSPLLIRPGARYACAGDGLCCSDMHKIAPLTPRELRRLRLIDEDSAGIDPDIGERAITLHEGRCVFMRSDGLCEIHAVKPRVCHRFPYTLVATPHGGRVSIEHRCTCPNLWLDAPPVTAVRARTDLVDASGRLRPNHRVERVRMGGRRTLGFEAFLREEAGVLHALPVDPAKALGVAPFGPLRGSSWREVRDAMVAQDDDTMLDAALRWVGDGVGYAQAIGSATRRDRPWASGIERAALRGARAEPRLIYATWLADSLWSLMWTGYATFAQARGELATRLAIARYLAKRLGARGVRRDMAAVEAIIIVEIVGLTEWWEGVARRL